MTAPAHFCYTINQGATFEETPAWLCPPFPVRDIGGGQLVRAENGEPVSMADMVPMDFTGCSARTQLRTDILAPDVLLELSTSDGTIDLGLGNGKMRFLLSAEATKTLPFGSTPPAKWSEAVSHLDVTHPDGRVSRLGLISWKLKPGGNR